MLGLLAVKNTRNTTQIKFEIKVEMLAVGHCFEELNPAKKETPHSFEGQQLENKLLYRFVIYMSFLEKCLSYNLTLSL